MNETVEKHSGWKHDFHAEAHALSGKVIVPLKQDITPHALTVVPKEGGYRAQQAQQYRLETIISYGRAHTQVAGHEELKEIGGWNTLATAVVEDVNILNVVTADRVVAQIFTHHPEKRHVPRINFLGTHFYNLRIAGHPVDVKLNLEPFGGQLEDDGPYTGLAEFTNKVAGQHSELRKHDGFLEKIFDKYRPKSEESVVLVETDEKTGKKTETVTCSLVGEVREAPKEIMCGHVITVRDFGKIFLAEVTLTHEDFNDRGIPLKTTVALDMIRVEMGCATNGCQNVACALTNGTTHPPKGGGNGG